ncbi:hypothetical protein KKA14_16395, partial [bacterium]|nr:hypothetical protein [bacterium]
MKLFYCKVAIITILSCSILDVSFATTRNITLDFRDVEVLTFIKLIGKVTDKTFVFNDKILKGKQITILSNQKFTPEETYKIFESILDINDLSLIDEGNVTRIVDSKTAKISSVQIYGEGKTIDSG